MNSKPITSLEQLSKPARALVRRFLRDKEALGVPGHGRCVPESVAWECTEAGLAVQVEYDDGALGKDKIMLPLWPDKFRQRAAELGFDIEAAEAEDPDDA